MTRLEILAAALTGLTNEQAKDVINNYSSESVQCIVFFMIAHEGLKRGRNLESHALVIIEYTIEMLFDEAAYLMELDVLEATMRLTFKDLVDKKLKKDFGRLAIINNEFAELCRKHVNNPVSRIIYWRKILGYR